MRLVGLAALLMLICVSAAEPASLPVLDTSQARQAAELMKHSDNDGLDPTQYVSGDTAALLAFARDIALGRSGTRSPKSEVALPASDFDPQAVVAQAIREGKLAQLPDLLSPPYSEYAFLKNALAHYRAIAQAGGWPTLTTAAKDYAAGTQAALVRNRLSYEDEVVAGDPDADLTKALKRFQLHHGLDTDGVLGPATLAELNIPASSRADTIMADMERWRWMPRVLEPDRIVINAAAADLVLVLGNHVVLTSRVIVGRPRDRTPILRAEVVGLTVNPSWTVPTTIAAREILPKLKRNRNWLAAHDMVLLNGPPGDPTGLTVNWRAIRADKFSYRLRQQPGPENPLGQIKIDLPNRFDVYLHDTPGRSAFARRDRHLSHGCVRVESIVPLASYAMSSDLDSMEMILSAIETGETTYMRLHRKLPVYFLYWTAFPGPDGAIAFRPDIYGRGVPVLASLRRPLRVAGETRDFCAKS